VRKEEKFLQPCFYPIVAKEDSLSHFPECRLPARAAGFSPTGESGTLESDENLLQEGDP